MRKILILVPLLFASAPAFAQAAAPTVELPRELTSPQAAMGFAMKFQAISDALLNVRVGEIGAALEGREATPRERNTTVRDIVHRQDPNFEQHFRQKVATVGPEVVRSIQAVNRALPQVLGEAQRLQKSVERAVGNLPDPTYPVR
jgi:hypothetical protein